MSKRHEQTLLENDLDSVRNEWILSSRKPRQPGKEPHTSNARPYLYEPIARLMSNTPPAYDDKHRTLPHRTVRKSRNYSKTNRSANLELQKLQDATGDQQISGKTKATPENAGNTSGCERETGISNRSSIPVNSCRRSIGAAHKDKVKAKWQIFCLTGKRATTICVLGVGLVLLGFLVAVGFFSVSSLTSSVNHAEPHIPTYVSASTMIFCGLLAIITARKYHKLLVVAVVLLSIVCTVFCFLSLLYLATHVVANLAHLENCTFNARVKMCSCYVKRGHSIKELHFEDVTNCATVKDSLKEIVYGVCVLFAIGFSISVATAACTSYLLYRERKNRSTRRSVIARTLGDGSINTNSATTQTQESSFTIPVRWEATLSAANIHDNSLQAERHEAISVSGTASSSTVSTQTPMLMVPVSHLVYELHEQCGDYNLGLLIRGRDDPPPPYSAAVSR